MTISDSKSQTTITEARGILKDCPPTTIEVPVVWLAAVAKLVNEMAGEGICMDDCADPQDLMGELAEYLGVMDDDDCWNAAVAKVENHGR